MAFRWAFTAGLAVGGLMGMWVVGPFDRYREWEIRALLSWHGACFY
jgi:hypothetical protein